MRSGTPLKNVLGHGAGFFSGGGLSDGTHRKLSRTGSIVKVSSTQAITTSVEDGSDTSPASAACPFAAPSSMPNVDPSAAAPSEAWDAPLVLEKKTSFVEMAKKKTKRALRTRREVKQDEKLALQPNDAPRTWSEYAALYSVSTARPFWDQS